MNSQADLSEKAFFLGLRFNLLDEASAGETVLGLAGQRPFSYVVTPNVDHMVRLLANEGDQRLWSAYDRAALCLCDSKILQGLAAGSAVSLPLVRGSDMTAAILDTHSGLISVAVIGGDARLMRHLKVRYPDIEWTHHEPPRGILYNPQAQLDAVHFVEASEAGIYFFAIGSPQSELICALINQRAKAQGVGLCIGASLEFLTGAKARAPRWMQRVGLEWLFRLLSEPGRLWRRYLVHGPTIFWYWATWRLKAVR